LSALDGLNDAQREAASTVAGPLLILAGPGSGKTRVIVHRIAYLLEQRVAPLSVVAVTFTNKAAREMRERLEPLVGPQARLLTVGTFHATCARWLRRDIHYLGQDPGFAIFDDNDQMDLVKSISRELAIDDKRFTPRMILSEISSAKSELIGPADYAQQAEGRYRETVARVYQRYQAALAENHALDFDDLLLTTVHLFQQFPAVLERYQERYRYILVDEFQDTNLVQYQLARLLAAKYRNICVVGDPDQSIYGWRKADIRNILNFEHDYPNLKMVVLEQNYRSTQTILDVADAIISANRLRKEKSLWTENPSGGEVVLFQAFDEREEAQFVVREIARAAANQGRLSEMAVMYRTNAQSRAMEDALVRAGVPYRLVGGTRFYERREVKDLLAYLRLVQNPYDSVSLMRVINVPTRGLGAKTVAELGRWARTLGVSLYEALQQAVGRGLAGPDGSGPVIPFAGRAREALAGFLSLLEGVREQRSTLPLAELIGLLIERTGYERYLRDGSEEGEERWQNVVELRTKATDYDDLEPETAVQRFLEEVSLVQDVDALESSGEAVTLITLHAAKGLEYPYVFILGLEEGLCPHVRSLDDPAQLEEERRLFYVGVTRAMRNLYLLHASRRTQYGGASYRDPSRFLDDIPPRLLRPAAARPARFREPFGERFDDAEAEREEWAEPSRTPAALNYRLPTAGRAEPAPAWMTEPDPYFEPSAPAQRREPSFRKGEQVAHPAFGQGVVLESQMIADDEQVTVLFKGHPTPKKLSLAFTRLERV
jgi:DNA helicase-2/ATP-dependent DNA helicase PcrA